jgi:recombination protein RecA
MPAKKTATKKTTKSAKMSDEELIAMEDGEEAKKSDRADGTKPTDADAKRKSIELAIKEIKTKFGDEAIMTFGAGKPAAMPFIPTGSIGLDAALGIGGMPQGRIIEIFGPESSGKTTLALHVIAEAQKKGGARA